MKRKFMTLAIAVGLVLALSVPVGAAELKDAHQGTVCEGSEVLVQLHFVNNKIPEGAAAGWLTVILNDGGTTIGPVEADRVNRRTQHWTVTVGGADVLIDAFTTTTIGGTVQLEGMLVLSDFKCAKKS